MYIIVIALVASLLPLAPAAVFAVRRRRTPPDKVARRLVIGLGSLDLVVALMMVGLGLVWLFVPGTVLAAEGTEASGDIWIPLAAAVSVSVGSIGAAYAVSTVGSAAIGAIAERPEIGGRALIFVGLAEGVAIYGLIIAFMILSR